MLKLLMLDQLVRAQDAAFRQRCKRLDYGSAFRQEREEMEARQRQRRPVAAQRRRPSWLKLDGLAHLFKVWARPGRGG